MTVVEVVVWRLCKIPSNHTSYHFVMYKLHNICDWKPFCMFMLTSYHENVFVYFWYHKANLCYVWYTIVFSIILIPGISFLVYTCTYFCKIMFWINCWKTKTVVNYIGKQKILSRIGNEDWTISVVICIQNTSE